MGNYFLSFLSGICPYMSIYWSALLRIKDFSDQKTAKDWSVRNIKLHNLRNLWSYVTLKRVMRWKPFLVMLVRDLSIYGSSVLKTKDPSNEKNSPGLIFQEYKIIKLHNLRNLWNYVILKRVMRCKTLSVLPYLQYQRTAQRMISPQRWCRLWKWFIYWTFSWNPIFNTAIFPLL